MMYWTGVPLPALSAGMAPALIFSISMPFGSPWDGRIPQSEIDSIIDAYLDVGITEISLAIRVNDSSRRFPDF